jgi:hypothetical protein
MGQQSRQGLGTDNGWCGMQPVKGGSVEHRRWCPLLVFGGLKMLQVQCDKCQKQFWVKGYTTSDYFTDTAEVVTELECQDEICQCLKDGEAFSVVDEEYESFDDDVI